MLASPLQKKVSISLRNTPGSRKAGTRILPGRTRTQDPSGARSIHGRIAVQEPANDVCPINQDSATQTSVLGAGDGNAPGGGQGPTT